MYPKIVLLCLMLGLGGMAAAQDSPATREDIIELMGQLPDMSGMRERLTAQGFSGEKLALAEEHERRLMTDKAVTGYIADRLIAVYDGNLPRAWAPQGLIAPLFDNGYTHLPTSDKALYYKVQLAILNSMQPRECGLLVKGRMSEQRMDRLVGQAEARLSAPTLKRYYALQREAIRNGISRAPKTLSPADSARIQEKINETLRLRVEADPALRSIGSAFDNFNRAKPAHACEAVKLYYDVVLKMKGRDLQHALIYLHEE